MAFSSCLTFILGGLAFLHTAWLPRPAAPRALALNPTPLHTPPPGRHGTRCGFVPPSRADAYVFLSCCYTASGLCRWRVCCRVTCHAGGAWGWAMGLGRRAAVRLVSTSACPRRQCLCFCAASWLPLCTLPLASASFMGALLLHCCMHLRIGCLHARLAKLPRLAAVRCLWIHT